MRPFALLALAAGASAYSQPGVPPQCLDSYACVFHAGSAAGLNADYYWDLRPLCARAGSEYVAQRDPSCVADAATGQCPSRCLDCSADKRPSLRFNVCGAVSGPIAPVQEEACPHGAGGCPGGVGSLQEAPIPASHGVAVMYIEGYPGPQPPAGYGPAPAPGQPFGCADVDTCDQAYNPACLPGSANYPVNPAITDATYAARASQCSSSGPGYCAPSARWCCAVNATPCTKQAEVFALPSGAPPTLSLMSEGSPSGIVLSYPGAPPYAADTFPCTAKDAPPDPSTGNLPQRTFTLRLACNASATEGIANLHFGEVSLCQMVAQGSSAAACGSTASPFASNQTAPPAAPPAAQPASAWSTTAVATVGGGGFLGGTLAGALGLLALSCCCRKRAEAADPPEYETYATPFRSAAY